MDEEIAQNNETPDAQSLSVSTLSATSEKLKKIDFKNLPDESTPINNTNLNQMQQNMEDAISDENIFNSIFEEVV